jgi:hypothetical protein
MTTSAKSPLLAPGHFPILDTSIRGRWKRIYGELEFEGVGEPMPVPPGMIRVVGLYGPGLVSHETYERARHYQAEGWCYQ